MKRLKFVFPLALAACLLSCSRQATDTGQTVNPVLGDISFISRFGHSPTAQTDERLRIQTHLEYAERLLREKDVTYFTPALQAKRGRLLRLLHDYRVAGIFPKNYDYADKRVPCFIDKEGRICAVGYLVEQTAGRQAAEAINRTYKYEKLPAINDPIVDDWIATSGLTKEEAAMIQPSYGYTLPPDNNHIAPEYGTLSAVLSGVNLSVTAVNGIQMLKPAKSKAAPIAGLITGVGQVVLGAKNFPEEKTGWYGNGTNESQKMLSMANIGLGTATIVLSAWNLLTNRKPHDKRTTWNMYSFPVQGRTAGPGFSVTRKF